MYQIYLFGSKKARVVTLLILHRFGTQVDDLCCIILNQIKSQKLCEISNNVKQR